MNFFVPGTPAPGGSKRFVGFGKKTGRAILIDAAGERNKNWRSIVGMVGAQAMAGESVFIGPLHVSMVFRMPRPKGHFNAKNQIKPAFLNAHPTTRPDVLKLARSTEDALTGICWNDDAQTVQLSLIKCYDDPGKGSGCQITITPLV